MASNENCWSPLAPETLPSRPTRTGASDVVTYNDFCLAAKHEWKTPLEVISRGKAGRTRTKTLTGEDSSFLLLVLSLALAWLPLLILFVMEGDLDQVNRGGRKKPSGRKWSGVSISGVLVHWGRNRGVESGDRRGCWQREGCWCHRWFELVSLHQAPAPTLPASTN